MSEAGDKLGTAYRAIAREEPRADIDAAILAASRRAVLARPSAARRWAAPVSIAAVLVLAFGVSLHMQQEKPGIESADPYASRPPASAALPAPKPQAQPDAQSQNVAPQAQDALAPKPEKKAKVAQAPQAKLQSAPVPMPAARVESDRGFRDEARADAAPRDKDAALKKEAYAATPAPAAREEAARSATLAAAPAAPAPAAAAPAAGAAAQAIAPPPARAQANEAGLAAQSRLKRDMKEVAAPDEETRELEAIAKLRAEGRHEEADKALAEFRRKRPDYRIPEAMWERVKAR